MLKQGELGPEQLDSLEQLLAVYGMTLDRNRPACQQPVSRKSWQ